MPESVVLLHGFGGTRRAWDGVVAHLDRERYRPLALDLPGHGAGATARGRSRSRAASRTCSTQRAAALLAVRLLARRARRAARRAGGPAPRARASCSCRRAPGSRTPSQRAARLRRGRAPGRRAAGRATFEDFIERWRAQPLFAGEPPEVGELARADQRRNDPTALAAALRGLSAGRMEPLWDRARAASPCR